MATFTVPTAAAGGRTLAGQTHDAKKKSYSYVLQLSICLGQLYGGRIPKAALMARSYLPSKVSEIVALWRKDLNKINQKAAESLADPEEYPNMFEDWHVALAVEAKAAETRGNFPPVAEYMQHADRLTASLVETFRNMQIEEDEYLENGVLDYEDGEPNGELSQEQDDTQVERHDESQEEDVVVDADSTDGAVLVNGNEAEEEWGMNDEEKPSV